MKRLALSVGILCMLWQWVNTQAKEANAMQLMYVVKKVFPETNDVALLIPKQNFDDNEKAHIARGAANAKLKVTVYAIDAHMDIGNAMKSLNDQSVLVVISSGILAESSSKLFLLSKCKERDISIIATSRDYAQSGALLGLVSENNRTQLILNLKHSREELKGRFTESFVQELGIQEIIP